MSVEPAFLNEVAHRPWPRPARPWSWRQSWLDLAFLHYRVEARELRRRIPESLRLDEFAGTAWVSLVPFRMSGVARRPWPVLPGFGSFPELNLRTYVEAEGKPGVWFFSLDAASWPIVLGGRLLYGLPYYRARMSLSVGDGEYRIDSVRRDGRARFAARYRPRGPVFHARPGSFEHWVAERYCLYARARDGSLGRVEVHHAAWPLQQVEVEVEHDSLLPGSGLGVGGEPEVSHFSRGVDVVSYALERVVKKPGAADPSPRA